MFNNVKCREQNVGDKNKPLSSLKIWRYSIDELIDLRNTHVFLRSTSLITHTTPMLLPLNGFKIKEACSRS